MSGLNAILKEKTHLYLGLPQIATAPKRRRHLLLENGNVGLSG
jgi:hypothetical protein